MTSLNILTRQSSIVSDMLNNWDVATKALEVSENSLGATTQANAIYMDSIQAKTAQLSETFQELSSNLLDSGLVKGVVDLASGLLQGANSAVKFAGALPMIASTIAAIVSSYQLIKTGKTSGIVSLILGDNASISVIKECGTAITAYNSNITKSKVCQDAWIKSVSSQNSELGNYITSLNGAKGSLSDYIGYLVKAKAAEIGMKVAAVALNTAITFGVSFAVSKGFELIDKLIHSAENARDAAEELESKTKEEISSIDSEKESVKQLAEQYEKLGKSNSGQTADIAEAGQLQKQLKDLVGDQANAVDLVNGKYESQLALLKQIGTYTDDELGNYTENVGHASDALIAAYKADKSLFTGSGLTQDWKNNPDGSMSHYGMAKGKNSGIDKQASDILNQAGFENQWHFNLGDVANGAYSFEDFGLSDNASADDIVADYDKINQALTALSNSSLGAEATQSTLFQSLAATRDALKSYVEDYRSAVQQQLSAKATNQIATDLTTTDIGSQGDFEKYIQSIKDNTEYSAQYKTVLIDTANQAFPQYAAAYQDMVNKIAQADLDGYLKNVSVDSQDAFNNLWDTVENTDNQWTDDEKAALEQLIIKTFPDYAASAGLVSDANSKTEKSSDSATSSAEDLSSAWSDVNSSIDSVQSAYNGLTSAVDEYNAHGSLSLDTLQSLMTMDDSYLACLEESNGKLSLNTALIQAKAEEQINAAKAAATDQAITELNAIAQEDSANATNAATGTMSAQATVAAALSGDLAAAAAAAAGYAESEALLSAYRSASIKDSQAAKQVMSGLSEKYALCDSAMASLKSTTGGLDSAMRGYSSSADKAASSTNNLKTAAEEAAEKEQNRLKIYGQAATKEIEKRIDKLNDEKDAFEKDIQSQIDNLNKLKDAQDKAYEDRIDALNDEKDALGDKNDEEDRAIKLAQLQQALAEAQSAKTKRMYVEGQGYIWTADQSAIDDAQKNLDDQIRQNARDDATKAIEDEIDAINKEKDAYDDSIAAQIDDLNNRKDAFDANIQDQVDQLNALKDKYQEAIDLIGTSWDDYQTQLQAAAEFSKMSYDQMTSYSTSFKDQVVANMQAIKAASDAAAAAQAGVGSGGGGETESHGYRVTLITGNVTSAKDFNTLAEAQSYADRNRNRNPSVSKFASGSLGVQGSQWGITQEAGNELIVRRPNVGQYTYLEDGDGVIPADITSRLFDIGANPSSWFAKELSAAGAVISKGQSVYSVKTGNIIIEKPVGSADDLASAIKEKFPSVMLQMVSKR